jgi:uncharacterized protein
MMATGHRASALVITAIRLYQRLISSWLPRRCKYEPTCSAYALSAVRVFGVPRGLVLAGWRVLRCNPFSHGGYDPVEAQTLFGRDRSVPRRPSREAPAANSRS